MNIIEFLTDFKVIACLLVIMFINLGYIRYYFKTKNAELLIMPCATIIYIILLMIFLFNSTLSVLIAIIIFIIILILPSEYIPTRKEK